MTINAHVTITTSSDTLAGLRELVTDAAACDTDPNLPVTVAEPITVTGTHSSATLTGGTVPLGDITHFVDGLHDIDANTPAQGATNISITVPVHDVEPATCGDHIPTADDHRLPVMLCVCISAQCANEHP